MICGRKYDLQEETGFFEDEISKKLVVYLMDSKSCYCFRLNSLRDSLKPACSYGMTRSMTGPTLFRMSLSKSSHAYG